MNEEIRPACPKCGSTEIWKHGIQILSKGIRKQRWKCKKCGHIWY